MEHPKSLTVTIHIEFHEDGSQAKGDGEVELISRMMKQASRLDPESQELLVKFADFLIYDRGNKAESS